MPTTIHLPTPLLIALDRRAKSRHISRNRLIVRALEQVVEKRSTWAAGFLDRLRDVDSATAADVDVLMFDIKQARRSKRPPVL